MSGFKPMELHINKQVFDTETLAMEGDTSVTVGLSLPTATGYLIKIFARVTTAFAGITSPTVKVGTTNDTDVLMQDQPIDKVGDLIWGRKHQGFCENIEIPGGGSRSLPLVLTFTSGSEDWDSLSAGAIEFVTLYVTEKQT